MSAPSPPSDAPAAAGRAGPSSARRLPRGAVPLLVLAGATVLGLIEASQVQYDRAVQGAPISWGHALTHGLPRWLAWALLVPGILFVSRAVRARGLGLPATVLVHALAGVAFTLVQVFLFSSVSTALHGQPGLVDHLRPAFLKYVGLTFLGGLVTYALIVLAWNGWRVYRAGRRREHEAARLELRAAELKALLAEAQLGHLQSQLQPHFLFNSLHTLGALIRAGDESSAARLTQRLSELLRQSLQLSERPEIPLRDELALLDRYVEIQRLRFGERLRVSIDGVDADERLGAALVPTLLLQPLVENAIRHGVERRAGAGRIDVSARREGERLVLRVRDDGPGPEKPVTTGTGVGLENSRARLGELYGDDASLTLAAVEEGGAEATVRLPFHTEPVVPRAARGTRQASA